MGKITVLVLALCSILMFLLVLQTPPQVVKNSYIYQKYFNPNEQREPVEEEAAPAASKASAHRKVLAVTTRSVQIMAPATAQVPPTTEPLGTPAQSDLPAKPASPNLAISDDAPVYSSNTPSSTVLQILNKGQIVEVDIEVITPAGKWTLVKVPRQNLSGFVRSDGIFLTPSGEQAQSLSSQAAK